MTDPRIGSLFTGYGGLDIATQTIFGGDVEWLAEIDKGAKKILEHRYADIPNLGDVTEIDWTRIPGVDILTGGTPCQDLSHAGRRAGMTKGTRSNLWVAMREAIAQLRPGIVIWENVGGALSATADSAMESCPGCMGDGSGEFVLRALGRVLGDLASLGYDARWRGLRAADVGAPHGRFRIFVVATDTHDRRRWESHAKLGRLSIADTDRQRNLTMLGTPSARQWTDNDGERLAESARRRHLEAQVRLLPTPDVSSGQRSPGSHATGAHQVSLQDLPNLLPTPGAGDSDHGPRSQAALDAGNRQTNLTDIQRLLLPTPTSADSKASGGRPDENNVSLTDAIVRGRGGMLLPTPNNFHSQNTESPNEWMTRRADVQERTGTRHGPALPVVAWSIFDGHPLAQQGNGPQLVDSAGDKWGPYANAVHRWETLIGRDAPEPTQPSRTGNPQLSPTFVEWLMGLPAGWVTDTPGLTRNEALRALGNGVVPQQAIAAVTAMLTWQMPTTITEWWDELLNAYDEYAGAS